MKPAFDWLLEFLALCFLVILALLPFHAFFSTWGGSAIGHLLAWKSWKEILLLLLTPIVLVYLWRHRQLLAQLWSRTINKLIILYFILNIVWSLFSLAGLEATLAGLMFNLRFLAMFLLAQLLVQSGLPWLGKLKGALITGLFVVTIIVSILAIVQVTVLPPDFLVAFGYDKDFSIAPYILVDENQGVLRAFATLRGPNTLGAFLILPLALALAVMLKQPKNILALLTLSFGVIALILTFSRSAWLGCLVALVAVALIMLSKKHLRSLIIFGLPTAVILFASIFWLATTVPSLRLAIFHSSPGDSTLHEGSSQQHWQATLNGLAQVIENPFGQGVGMAGPASFYAEQPNLAENYFIQIAQEVGVFGLAIFMMTCLVLVKQLWKNKQEPTNAALLASFFGISLVGIFLHSWADDPTAMTWWAIAGIFAFSPGKSKVST